MTFGFLLHFCNLLPCLLGLVLLRALCLMVHIFDTIGFTHSPSSSSLLPGQQKCCAQLSGVHGSLGFPKLPLLFFERYAGDLHFFINDSSHCSELCSIVLNFNHGLDWRFILIRHYTVVFCHSTCLEAPLLLSYIVLSLFQILCAVIQPEIPSTSSIVRYNDVRVT